jgi:hypothetical protein
MMKTFAIVLLLFVFQISSILGQAVDPGASVSGRTEGFITKADLQKTEKLVPNSPDIVIMGFTLSYPIPGDDVEEWVSKSDQLTSEMKEKIALLKAGTIVSFENIKAKKEGKTLILESINLEIKE